MNNTAVKLEDRVIPKDLDPISKNDWINTQLFDPQNPTPDFFGELYIKTGGASFDVTVFGGSRDTVFYSMGSEPKPDRIEEIHIDKVRLYRSVCEY